MVSFLVDNRTEQSSRDDWDQLLIIYNAEDKTSVTLPSGNWTVLADKSGTDCLKQPSFTKDGQLIVEARCGMMLGRKVE